MKPIRRMPSVVPQIGSVSVVSIICPPNRADRRSPQVRTNERVMNAMLSTTARISPRLSFSRTGRMSVITYDSLMAESLRKFPASIGDGVSGS